MNAAHPIKPSLFHVQYQLEQRRVPFTRDAVSQLPKGRCGLYALWIADDIGGYQRLYAGVSTTCIRRRLRQHLSDEQNPELRIQLRTFGELIHFSVVFTEDPEQTVALETELIRAWRPETNRYKLR